MHTISARVSLAIGEVLDGDLPLRAARLVREWTGLHGDELAENWRLAQELQPLKQIEPLR
jgi:hypothetical protein